MFQQFGQNIPQLQPFELNIPAPKKRGGMFGNADWGSALAAALGGFAAGMGNPAGAQALQALHGQRMMKQRAEAEEQQYQRQRMDGLEDYEAKLGIAQRFKGPDYDAFQTRLIESGVQPGSPEWVNAHKRKSELDLNPMVMTAFGPMPYSAVVGAQQPQQGLPQTLSDDDFAPQGGPSPLGSGGFPRPY
jgi:hypothetical protein